MKVVSISDIHMRSEDDFCERALYEFLGNELVTSSDMIVFNGDIFDYAAGFHPAYWDRFQRFFTRLKELISDSKKIVFIEGNHDIHLEKVFRRYFQQFDINQDNFIYVTKSIVIDTGERHLYFSHGDEIPGSKPEYIKYKKIIRSRILQVLSSLFPLWFFDMLAIKASGNSRQRSSQHDEKKTQDFYRKAIKSLRKDHPMVNDFILGHSHLEESSSFYNTGFSPQTRKFFYFDGSKSELVSF